MDKVAKITSIEYRFFSWTKWTQKWTLFFSQLQIFHVMSACLFGSQISKWEQFAFTRITNLLSLNGAWLFISLSLSVVKGGYNYDIKMLNMLSTSVRNELKAFTPTRIISLLLRVVDCHWIDINEWVPGTISHIRCQ